MCKLCMYSTCMYYEHKHVGAELNIKKDKKDEDLDYLNLISQ